jgi:hypothetical protein
MNKYKMFLKVLRDITLVAAGVSIGRDDPFALTVFLFGLGVFIDEVFVERIFGADEKK